MTSTASSPLGSSKKTREDSVFGELPFEIKVLICQLLIRPDTEDERPGDCREVHSLSKAWRQAALHATASLRLDPARLCVPYHRDLLVGFHNLNQVKLDLCTSSRPTLAIAWLSFAPQLVSLDVLGATDQNLLFLESLTGLTRLSLSTRDDGLEIRSSARLTELPAFGSSNRVRELDISGQSEVEDLAPLLQLTQLEGLDASRVLASLDPLAGLVSLTRLAIDDLVPLQADLTPLSGLRSLRWLSAWGLNADWTPVMALTGLTALFIGTSTSSAGAVVLSTLTRLQSLDVMCWRPPPDFRTLTRLTHVNLEDTGLTDVQCLSRLCSLVKLSIGSNLIEDLTPLTALQALAICKTSVSDLTPLVLIPSLTELHMGHTCVHDGRPLLAMPRFSTLTMGDSYEMVQERW